MKGINKHTNSCGHWVAMFSIIFMVEDLCDNETETILLNMLTYF